MIYLDAAATTFQKPRTVSKAVERAFHYMTTPGRGGYPAAKLAAETLFRCRSEAAQLFGAPNEEAVVFTTNATHALNIAIKTLVHPGDHVVVSGYEHNAVMRPLYGMKTVHIHKASAPLFDQDEILRNFAELITSDISCVICTHVSNVFGFILPIEKIALLCRERNVPLIIDASQSAGILPVNLRSSGAAFIAMPGHKGLYGPQGTGILLCATEAVPLIEGGTGSMSANMEMPEFLPDRLEAGTQNVCGIAGLLEGIRFVRKTEVHKIEKYERELIHFLQAGLCALPELIVYGSKTGQNQSGVLSFAVKDADCEQVASYLAKRGIAVRAGLHCAPCAHETAGTLNCGTVRVSVSAFNTEQEIRVFLGVIKEFLIRKDA